MVQGFQLLTGYARDEVLGRLHLASFAIHSIWEASSEDGATLCQELPVPESWLCRSERGPWGVGEPCQLSRPAERASSSRDGPRVAPPRAASRPSQERLRLRAALSRGLSRRAPKAPRGAASAASFAGLLQNRRKNGEANRTPRPRRSDAPFFLQAFLNYLCIKTLRVGSLFYFLGFQAAVPEAAPKRLLSSLCDSLLPLSGGHDAPE